MAFQIYAIVPTYDNRDAIVGSRAILQPNTYVTARGAHAIAGRLAQDGDDVYHVVVPVGASPFDSTKIVHPVGRPLSYDDIPF